MRTRKLIVIVLALIVAIDVVLLCAGGPDGAAAANPTTYQGVDTEQPVVPVNTTLNRDLAANLVRIRSPQSVINELSAAGAVELISKRQVVMEVDGTIDEVAVAVGDWVTAGDLLVALNAEELNRAVTRAEVDLATAEAELASYNKAATPARWLWPKQIWRHVRIWSKCSRAPPPKSSAPPRPKLRPPRQN
ncbi:MAG: biotin/lipoyl-binding protein [Caldilineaceae bacterium]